MGDLPPNTKHRRSELYLRQSVAVSASVRGGFYRPIVTFRMAVIDRCPGADSDSRIS